MQLNEYSKEQWDTRVKKHCLRISNFVLIYFRNHSTVKSIDFIVGTLNPNFTEEERTRIVNDIVDFGSRHKLSSPHNSTEKFKKLENFIYDYLSNEKWKERK
jgi:hypothetical protein